MYKPLQRNLPTMQVSAAQKKTAPVISSPMQVKRPYISLFSKVSPIAFSNGTLSNSSEVKPMQTGRPVQMMQEASEAAPQSTNTAPNNTGIPTQMKRKFEEKSGLSFDDVRVHYNSEKPAQLQALAYTQGNQVYVGRGQEKHLEHELGHVVQQKLGLVQETVRISGIPVNDDPTLEHAADTLPSLSKHQTKECSNTPVQCFRWTKFFTSYLHGLVGPITTASSLAAHPATPANWADLNPARWRIMPHNLITGFLNALEECSEQSQIPIGGGPAINVPANYHTSSRHGAHNSLWNAMGRLQVPSKMFDHYTLLDRVRNATKESRFNSESWERYAWVKGKEYFETVAQNAGYIVTWVSHNPFDSVAKNNWNVKLDFATKALGSSVGTTMAPAPGAPAGAPPVSTSTDRVQLAVNYILVPKSKNKLHAWNGQMFPIIAGLSGKTLSPPVAGVMPTAPVNLPDNV